MRFLSALSVVFLLLLSTSGVAYAAALPDNASDQEITDAGYLTDDEIAEAVGDPDDVPMVYDPDGNLVSGPAVQLAEADLKYAPYIGSGWITGTASGLGEVYIYVPISSRGSWGTTSDGYLCNVGGNSVSGVLYTKAGTRYTFSCSSFAVPRYRLADSSVYSYTDLYLSVTGSNLRIATDFPPAVPFSDSYPLIMLGVMGVMILCLMRYRH